MDWLLRQANVSGNLREQRSALLWTWQEPWVLFVGSVFVVVASVLLFRWQRRRLPHASRRLLIALTACRTFVLLIFVMILAGPMVRLQAEHTVKPAVVFLLDESTSMNLPAPPYASRRQLLEHELQRLAALEFPALSERFELTLIAFAQDQRKLAEHRSITLEPRVARSAIGDALHRVLSERNGQPLAGVVLLSDGENTAGRSLHEVESAYRGAKVPIFCVPVGPDQATNDVALREASGSGHVTLGDRARVGVVIASHGYDQQLATVRVRDGERVLDTKELVLRGSEQQLVELQFSADTPGKRWLVVEVLPLKDEASTTNNADVLTLDVREDKRKVLYIEGVPRWDFRFLKNAMRRDSGLMGRVAPQPDVLIETEWRRLPAAEQAKALPNTREELAAYHTVILGDVSPKLLSKNFVLLLEQAIRENGLGVVVQVGPQAMPHAFGEELHTLLPVFLDSGVAGRRATPSKPYTIELTTEGYTHEALQLFEQAERNRAAWSEMLPFQWSAATIRPKAGATVLAVNPAIRNTYGPCPLIAWHTVGRGRVLFIGTDSTWLWRQNVGDRFFDKVWGQAIRFVARSDEQASKKSQLAITPQRLNPGTMTSVEVLARHDGKPLTTPTLSLDVDGPENTTLELQANNKQPGLYIGNYPFPQAGDYRLRQTDSQLDVAIPVLANAEEERQLNVNRTALKSLADRTDGQLLELDDPSWFSQVRDRLHGEAIRTQRLYEASVWDNWLVVALLVCIYCLEIGIRRWAGLS